MARKKQNNSAKLGFEEKLWQAADKMRGHMDAAEYKHVALGLVFLKYISDAFEEFRGKLAGIEREMSSGATNWTVTDNQAVVRCDLLLTDPPQGVLPHVTWDNPPGGIELLTSEWCRRCAGDFLLAGPTPNVCSRPIMPISQMSYSSGGYQLPRRASPHVQMDGFRYPPNLRPLQQ